VAVTVDPFRRIADSRLLSEQRTYARVRRLGLHGVRGGARGAEDDIPRRRPAGTPGPAQDEGAVVSDTHTRPGQDTPGRREAAERKDSSRSHQELGHRADPRSRFPDPASRPCNTPVASAVSPSVRCGETAARLSRTAGAAGQPGDGAGAVGMMILVAGASRDSDTGGAPAAPAGLPGPGPQGRAARPPPRPPWARARKKPPSHL
jgi:hypothetical protein